MENLQRRDLDFVEEATALQKLIFTYHLSQEEAARRVGKSQSAVANKLRLLKLDKALLDKLLAAGLTERHGRALLRLPAEQRSEALEHIVAEQLTVAKTEAYIDKLLAPAKPPKSKKKPLIYIKDIRLFLNTLNRSLGMMNQAGVGASCGKEETEEEIVLTITIPKTPA